MKTRKSHSKSRRGCTNCKARHLKCDEQGPPCANCASRGTTSTCLFSTAVQKLRPPRQIQPSRESLGSAIDVPQNLLQAPSLLGAPADITSLLHLELMHRWSTTTYKAFVVVPPDVDLMQTAIVQCGLEHASLLNAVLASAALDIASTGHPQASTYTRRAMEFYDAASQPFRAQLMQVDLQNLEWMFLYSSMFSMSSLALLSAAPAYGAHTRSAIEATTTMFELYIGAAILAQRDSTGLLLRSCTSSKVYFQHAVAETLGTDLHPDTEDTFSRLYTIVDFLEAHPQCMRCSSNKPRLFKTWDIMYRQAVLQLRRCFVEDEKQKMAGFCTAYSVLIGPDFTRCVRDVDPMALLLLTIWAVLVDRLSNVAWWAKDLGRKLAAETTAILLTEEGGIAELSEFHDCITWANSQIGKWTLTVLPWDDQQWGSNKVNFALVEVGRLPDMAAS